MEKTVRNFGVADDPEIIKMRVIGNEGLYSGTMTPSPSDFIGSNFPTPLFASQFSPDLTALGVGAGAIANTPDGTIYGNVENLSISGERPSNVFLTSELMHSKTVSFYLDTLENKS